MGTEKAIIPVRAPCVIAVSASSEHRFRKQIRGAITLIKGFGVEGDAHGGAFVQHLYDKAKDPTRRNLRQVHLVEEQLIHELTALGFCVEPGDLGENITTRNIELTGLVAGAVLQLGTQARIRITGLRAPCIKLDRLQRGLRRAVTYRVNGGAAMKHAVLAEVITGGIVRAFDPIEMKIPDVIRPGVLGLV